MQELSQRGLFCVQSFLFAILWRKNRCNFDWIAWIVAEHPDFVLQTGDLITGAQTLPTSSAYKKFDMQYANYKKVTTPLAQANIPLYVIRGNKAYFTYGNYFAKISGSDHCSIY